MEGKELDIATKLADFRKKVIKGEEVSDEELRDAINDLRTFRDKTAMPVKEAAAKKAVKKTSKQEANDFFKDLL